MLQLIKRDFIHLKEVLNYYFVCLLLHKNSNTIFKLLLLFSNVPVNSHKAIFCISLSAEIPVSPCTADNKL